MDKSTLDNLLDKHKAQPVGSGYIDIIFSRDNYKDFFSYLVAQGFKVSGISWWEWCKDNNKNKYGLGGPKSTYYTGWFSEIPVNVDDLDFSTLIDKDSIIDQIVRRIESKTISLADETVAFSDSNCITPAIWLNVPNDWRNKYSR